MKSEKRKYLIVLVLLILVFAVGCGQTLFTVGDKNDALLPIAKDVYGKGGSWDFLVYPMAWLMFFVANNIVFKNYALAILITTVLIRSIAWPIYGKTNDMSLKMTLINPEMQKIEAKYEGKLDKESQQRKSMELMQLYKKYKISFSGCLMPFIQMPIFLAFYETLKRIPYTSQAFINNYGSTFTNSKTTVEIVELLYNVDTLNTKFLGIDLLKDQSEGGWQRVGIIILAVLVAGTQLLTQILSQKRTEKQKEKMNGTVPEYRRKNANEQQQQTEKMMKVMLYVMPFMMVIFIWQSPAALGWYWLVGNLYTAFQGFISSKQSAKKMEKLREKYDKNIIRY